MELENCGICKKEGVGNRNKEKNKGRKCNYSDRQGLRVTCPYFPIHGSNFVKSLVVLKPNLPFYN